LPCCANGICAEAQGGCSPTVDGGHACMVRQGP
jgi:hypothetical protein